MENGDIVASSESGLYLVDPDDGTRSAVVGTQDALEPVWSPDASSIAFTRARVESSKAWEAIVYDLHVVRPDGTERRLVTRNASAPSWSPDGKQIVFMRDICGLRPCLNIHNPNDLFIVDVESGDEQRLTANERYDGDPAWSPNGAWIAFASEDGLALVHPDGTGRHLLTRKWEDSNPSWSPDGKSILFADYVDVYVIAIDGGRAQRLTDNRGPDFNPVWSPDGTKIAYVSNHVCAQRNGCTAHEPVHIRVMDADGSESRALTEDGWGSPSWGPRRGEPN